jgi:hypothetical protein
VCSDLHRSGMFDYFETLYTVCVLICIVVVCLTTLRLYKIRTHTVYKVSK